MNIGILGLKGHQIVALEGARQLGDCRLVAVADDDPKLLADFMKQEPLAKDAQPYADWRHLVEHSMLDVAVCCDANHVHADQIVALAERGIDIVSEKPLATKLDDLARIRGALAKSKSHLTMLLTMRH